MPDKEERTPWKEARTGGEPLLGPRRVLPLRSEGSPAVGGGQARTQRPLGGWRWSALTHCFCHLPGEPEPGWGGQGESWASTGGGEPRPGLGWSHGGPQSGQSAVSSHGEPRHANMYLFLLHLKYIYPPPNHQEKNVTGLQRGCPRLGGDGLIRGFSFFLGRCAFPTGSIMSRS